MVRWSVQKVIFRNGLMLNKFVFIFLWLICASCFGSVIASNCQLVSVGEKALKEYSIDPAWSSVISQLEFCRVAGERRIMAGLSNSQEMSEGVYLAEVFSPTLLASYPNNESSERYYRLLSCRNECDDYIYSGQGYVLIRSPTAISKGGGEEFSNFLELIPCVENSECLSGIFENVGFFKKFIYGWDGEIVKILNSGELKVNGIDLITSGKEKIAVQVSSDTGSWSLVFDNNSFPKKNLLELNVVQY